MFPTERCTFFLEIIDNLLTNVIGLPIQEEINPKLRLSVTAKCTSGPNKLINA